jgi:hypothetical protein
VDDTETPTAPFPTPFDDPSSGDVDPSVIVDVCASANLMLACLCDEQMKRK